MSESQLPATWVRNRLLAGTLVLFAGRFALSAIRSGPVLVADEIGYLTNARVLAGGLPGQLHLAPFYKGGYSLLLAPLVDLASSPGFTYHLVLALNAALAASLFPLLYVLLVRFASVAPRTAIWAALAGAAYPAITVLSQVAISENALFPLVCVWIIAFGGLLTAREPRAELRWGVGLGASAAALWAVHNRMAVAVALTVGIIAWFGVRRRIRPATAAAVLLVTAVGFLASHLLDAYLLNHNFGGRVEHEASDRLSELVHGHGFRTAAANLLGQLWYLIVGTFGLVAVVAGDVVARARGKVTEEEPAPVGPILVGLAALLLLVSAAAFPVRTRPDMLIYGRYVEIVAPPLIALGLAILLRRRLLSKTSRAALAFAFLTVSVVLIRTTASDPDAVNRWNVSALPFITLELGPTILIGAAVVAVGGALLLIRSAPRGPGTVGAVAVGLFLAVTVYGAWNPIAMSQRAVYPSGWSSPERVAETDDIHSIAYDLDNYDTIGLYTVQWFLPHTSLLLFHSHRQASPSGYVISSAHEVTGVPKMRAALLWKDEGRDEALWRLPNPPSGR